MVFKKGKFISYIDEDNGLHMHLRIDPDGNGVLIINASVVVYLNRTAAFYVECFLKEMKPEKVAKKAVRKFKGLTREKAIQDYTRVINNVLSLAYSKVCPISSLGFEKVEPFSMRPSAPYRVDLALTYRCNNKCIHCYSSSPDASKEKGELSTKKWRKIIDKLFDVGVPQITFTGGEPTLRRDLVELISYTQKKGLVSTLVTIGRRLADKEYLRMLVEAGLDGIQITLESADPEVHDSITRVKGSWRETVEGIKNAVKEKVYIDVNMTLMKHNIAGIEKWVKFLHELGVENISANKVIYSGKAIELVEDLEPPVNDVEEALVRIKDLAEDLGMKFTWYGVTRYCELNPLELGLGIKSCSAALITLAVEPDGTVIPCQSYFRPLGNILRDKWEKIWNNPLAITLREAKYAPEKCFKCPLFNTCRGGCPLEYEVKKVVG
ncbi:MAG TPA: radical SAM protein [Thermoprotei archaeon]|nr:radical SAM protein [Thermoprotei archaeon]